MEYQAFTLREEVKIDSVVTIHYFEFCSDYAYHGERHPFWELLYVDKGEVEITAGERTLVLKKGEVVFHKPNEFHNIRANGIVAPNLVIFSFYTQSEAMKFFEERVMSVGDRAKDLMGRIVNEAEDAFSTPLNEIETKVLERSETAPFAAEQMVKLNLEILLIELIRQESEAQKPKITSLIKDKGQQEFIDKVARYLEENVHKRLTLSDICRDNLVGRSYLQKIFREKTGGGAMEYFGKLKIEAAKEMIREGNHNFTEIAAMLSYNSIHYFSRHFKKVTNMTPSEYASSVKILTVKGKKKS